MKNPTMSPPDPGNPKQLPKVPGGKAAIPQTEPEAHLDSIQFPVEGLNSISSSLPVRAMRRIESRGAFRLGRCALL